MSLYRAIDFKLYFTLPDIIGRELKSNKNVTKKQVKIFSNKVMLKKKLDFYG